MPANTKLTCLTGPLAGKVFQLGPAPLTIGRLPESSISLADDPGVSRNHAQLYLQSDCPFIVDLGSSNGTFVNGQRLTGPLPLTGGEMVALGSSTFRVDIDGPAPTRVASSGAPTCIHCGGNQVLSLQSVTASGVSSTVGTSVNVGGAHVLGGGPNLVGGSVGTSKSVTKTDLAKLLTMPFPPPKEEKYIDKVASTLGCGMFLVCSILLSATLKNFWLSVLIGIGVGLLVTFLIEAANKAKNQSAKAEHDRRQAEVQQVYIQQKTAYDRSFYCPQCHSVFDPVTGKCAKPEQLASIL